MLIKIEKYSLISYDKMYNIEIKKSVLEDLDEISDYIFRFTFSQETSNKIHDEIMWKILSLKVMPYMFPVFEDNFRVMTVKRKYRIFYKVDETKKKCNYSTYFLKWRRLSKFNTLKTQYKFIVFFLAFSLFIHIVFLLKIN